MKHEFKWYVTIELEIEDDDEENEEAHFKALQRSYVLAKDAIIDSLSSDDMNFRVIDEEDK